MLVGKAGDIGDTTFRRCRLDTAAPWNLVTKICLDGLKCEMRGCEGDEIWSLPGSIAPIGKVILRWKFRGEDEVHEDEFYVLPDYVMADFDCLLARDWMNNNGYEIVKKVIRCDACRQP